MKFANIHLLLSILSATSLVAPLAEAKKDKKAKKASKSGTSKSGKGDCIDNFDDLAAAVSGATDPASPSKIEVCGGTIDFTNAPNFGLDLSNKFFEMSCADKKEECVFDAKGTGAHFKGSSSGSTHDVTFEDITFEGGFLDDFVSDAWCCSLVEKEQTFKRLLLANNMTVACCSQLAWLRMEEASFSLMARPPSRIASFKTTKA